MFRQQADIPCFSSHTTKIFLLSWRGEVAHILSAMNALLFLKTVYAERRLIH